MLNALKYLMSNIFFHKILALGENFLSPTLNIIQPNKQEDWTKERSIQ
nr:MAG TPA: hypothetical protein [Caudoviricetes sp.]